MKKFLIVTAISALGFSNIALAGDTPAPTGAAVYFANLEDGATVKSPFKVIFGLSGMGIAPAGTEKDNTGHHHILIDRPALGNGSDGADEFDANLPSDDNHKHFGGGQTEVSLELSPGKHTLQLVLGDKDHIPHNPPVTSPVISITVQ